MDFEKFEIVKKVKFVQTPRNMIWLNKAQNLMLINTKHEIIIMNYNEALSSEEDQELYKICERTYISEIKLLSNSRIATAQNELFEIISIQGESLF